MGASASVGTFAICSTARLNRWRRQQAVVAREEHSRTGLPVLDILLRFTNSSADLKFALLCGSLAINATANGNHHMRYTHAYGHVQRDYGVGWGWDSVYGYYQGPISVMDMVMGAWSRSP